MIGESLLREFEAVVAGRQCVVESVQPHQRVGAGTETGRCARVGFGQSQQQLARLVVAPEPVEQHDHPLDELGMTLMSAHRDFHFGDEMLMEPGAP